MTEEEKVLKLDELYGIIQKDSKYRNNRMGTVFVPGSGSLRQNVLVFIGEAPGREEETACTPFVGPAGKNLDALLAQIGLSRNDVFVTNLVKYRPMDAKGGNRSPTSKESRYALPFLQEELQILKPPVVVCLGLSAAKSLLDDKLLKMQKANGSFFEKAGRKILVTYHPSPFNYQNPRKREALQEAFHHLKRFVKV